MLTSTNAISIYDDLETAITKLRNRIGSSADDTKSSAIAADADTESKPPAEEEPFVLKKTSPQFTT